MKSRRIRRKLTFDATNWDIDQTVDLTAVDDLVIDGDQFAIVNVDVNIGSGRDLSRSRRCRCLGARPGQRPRGDAGNHAESDRRRHDRE